MANYKLLDNGWGYLLILVKPTSHSYNPLPYHSNSGLDLCSALAFVGVFLCFDTVDLDPHGLSDLRSGLAFVQALLCLGMQCTVPETYLDMVHVNTHCDNL